MTFFPKPQSNKYKAQRTGDFPSKLEANAYAILQMLQINGDIRDLKRYPTVLLAGCIKWKVDFTYFNIKQNRQEWAEAKGQETYDYCLKKRLWKHGYGPGPLVIWKGSKPSPVEIVFPKTMVAETMVST